MSQYSRKKLAVSISAVVCAMAPFSAVLGQPGSEITEIVTVASPIRDSQRAAIQEKLNANNYKDVISADTIGRFPDQNLADSLGRMPGLAIERDQGQARYINFRGAPFRYTALAIDGVTIPGAENGRVPRFDGFPSVITSRIEANKAVTPDMPGESVAGYVNLSSFSPFDMEGFSVATDVGLGQQQLGDGDVERYSARVSWSGETLGMTLFGSKNSREQTTDNRELDLSLAPGGEVLVNELDFRSYKLVRSDAAWGGRLEYRPAGSMNRLFLSTLNSEFRDEEERNQYVFNFAGGASAAGGALVPGTTGSQPLVLVNRLLEDGIYTNGSNTHTLGADLQMGDWFVESRINATNTESTTFLPIPYSAGGMVSASYDVSDLEDPLVFIGQPFSGAPTDLASLSYSANLALVIASELEINATKIQVDGERDLELLGQPATLKIGSLMEQRDGEGFGTTQAMTPLPSGLDINSYNTGRAWDTDFTNAIGGTYYNNAQLRDDWSALVGGLTVTPAPDQLIVIDEDISALYAMATVHYDWGNVVAGTRMEHTQYDSTGPVDSFGDSFTHVLPSAHVNIDLRENLKLRLSASSAISRPTYTEWRAAVSLNPTEQEASGGNPRLKPEEAYGADISLEWYYGDASLLSAGAFARNISDVIYADSQNVDGGIYFPEAAGQEWSYTGFINGKDGQLRGVELNAIAQASDFFPGVIDGFGIDANVTLLDSEFTTQTGTTFALPGTSDLIFNSSVFYETSQMSLRLSYQFRDDWLSTTENNSMAEYWAAQERLDLSARYDLPFELWGAAPSLYLNINNLTDAVDVRYIGDDSTPNQVERFGRRYMVGMRVNF